MNKRTKTAISTRMTALILLGDKMSEYWDKHNENIREFSERSQSYQHAGIGLKGKHKTAHSRMEAKSDKLHKELYQFSKDTTEDEFNEIANSAEESCGELWDYTELMYDYS